jgi:hypothetical protein
MMAVDEAGGRLPVLRAPSDRLELALTVRPFDFFVRTAHISRPDQPIAATSQSRKNFTKRGKSPELCRRFRLYEPIYL